MLQTREGVSIVYALPVLLGQKLERTAFHMAQSVRIPSASTEWCCSAKAYFLRNLTNSSRETPVQIGRLINWYLSCLDHRSATFVSLCPGLALASTKGLPEHLQQVTTMEHHYGTHDSIRSSEQNQCIYCAPKRNLMRMPMYTCLKDIGVHAYAHMSQGCWGLVCQRVCSCVLTLEPLNLASTLSPVSMQSSVNALSTSAKLAIVQNMSDTAVHYTKQPLVQWVSFGTTA